MYITVFLLVDLVAFFMYLFTPFYVTIFLHCYVSVIVSSFVKNCYGGEAVAYLHLAFTKESLKNKSRYPKLEAADLKNGDF